ncbi:MAG: rhodanese-like domain-containing protein [Nanoarchaeota archaeon]
MEVIETKELKRIINSKKDYFLIDVRNNHELDYGMIPSAVHLCLQDFEEAFNLDERIFFDKYKFKKPSKSDLVIVYCRTGNRSGIAAEYLHKKGYKVKNYEGSIRAWSLIDKHVKMYGN